MAEGDKPVLLAPVKKKPDLPLPPAVLQNPAGDQIVQKPVAALQPLGFHGSIEDVNHRVQAFTDQHVKVHGTTPSPGLTLNVITSPVPPGSYPLLLRPPNVVSSSTGAKALQQHQLAQPDDFMVTNKWGMIQPDNPIRRMSAALPNPPVDVNYNQRKYIPEGLLPIPGLDHFYHAVARQPDRIQNAITPPQALKDYQAQQKRALRIAKGELPGQTLPSPDNPQVVAGQDVKSILQAQNNLKHLAPEYFSDLKSDGIINQDWASQIHAYMQSKKYVNQSLTFLAERNGFKNPQSYVKAFDHRAHLVESHAWFAQFLSALPLPVLGSARDFAGWLTGATAGPGLVDIPSTALHTVANTAKLALVGTAGTVNQAKADAAAVNEFVQKMAPAFVGVNDTTPNEAYAAMRKTLYENPTWMRVFYPGLPEDGPEWLRAIDNATNIAGDILLARYVTFGSKVPTGDFSAFQSSRTAQQATKLAFNAMKKQGMDGVGEATFVMQGGEKLHVAVAKAIQDGEMTLPSYRLAVSDLYHFGRTVDGSISGESILVSLRNKSIPTPSAFVKRASQHLDRFDTVMRNSPVIGSSSSATFVNYVRGLLSHISPNRALIYDAKTPQQLYDWTARTFNSREFANQVRNEFTVLRAKGDIAGIQDLNTRLLERYKAEYPKATGGRTPIETEGPKVEAESFSYLRMPKGQQAQGGAFQSIANHTQNVNRALNKAAQKLRGWIVSGALPGGIPAPGGGMSLFWKHATADTTRRILTGGGVRFALNAEEKATRAKVVTHLRDNPSAIRDLSASRAAAEMGEYQWLSGDGPSTVLNFDTADHLGDAARMKTAGGNLRHLVTDDAVNAYRATTKDNLAALEAHIRGNPFYEGKINADPAFVQAKGLAHAWSDPDAYIRAAHDAAVNRQAQALWKTYRGLEKSAEEAGIADPLLEATNLAALNAGAKVDTVLGKWISDNRISFRVEGPVSQSNRWDSATNWWIGKLLTFNKLNRKVYFDKAFLRWTKELTDHGWEMSDAVPAATEIARRQVVYNMLDFSNMLQVEQNLRWLSFFATKHRLYWKWIGRQAVTHPGQAALVADFGNYLKNGSIPFPIGDRHFLIPAARLFWVNNREYPETSPVAQFGAQLVKNIASGESLGDAAANGFGQLTETSGNVFSRNDQFLRTAVLFASSAIGKHPVTYGMAVNGMSPVQKRDFDNRVNSYIVDYRAHHDGAYPNEQDAVKHALMGEMANEYWRANLPFPILPDTTRPTPLQNALNEYGKITDPTKKRKFLEAHPQVVSFFGASGDQQEYLHEQPLWDEFNRLNTLREQRLQALIRTSRATGQAIDFTAVKKIRADYTKAVQHLELVDAQTWVGNASFPAGRVADNGEILQPGPWGAKLAGDPLRAGQDLKTLYPDMSSAAIQKGTVGQTVIDLQNEADRIRNLGWKKLGFPDEQHARDRLAQITEKISVFYGVPKSASGKLFQRYYDRLGAYVNERDKWVAKLGDPWVASSANKDKVFSEFRAWKEQFGEPVVIDGVKFPPLEQYGFTQLPPAEYHTALAQVAASRWQDVTGYEKRLLGVKTSPDVAEGWKAYQETVAAYKEKYPGAQLVKQQRDGLAKQIDGVYHGFEADYQFAQKPKVDRYTSTTIYKNLSPQVREPLDQYVLEPARKIAAAIKTGGHSTYYQGNWRNYVNQQLLPWLQEPAQKRLRAELTDLGGLDFLNTLPSNG